MSDKIKLALIDNIVWVICAALYGVFAILSPTGFLTWRNLEFIFYTSSMIGFLVLAEGLVLITGNLDLSLAQNAGLSAMVAAVLLGVVFPGLPGWLGIPIIVLTGTLLGALNGVLIGKIGYNAFLGTLATYLIFDWTTYWIRRGAVVNLPDAFLAAGSVKVGGIHIAIFIFIGVALILAFLLGKTRFGMRIYSTGGNPQTTRMMGIRVDNVLFWVFALAGTLAGLSGLLYSGYVGSVTSNIAQGNIFNAFAGAIIGGISLRGGRGTILGAFGGIILLGILEAGLTMMEVSPEIRGVLTGVVLLAAIAINMFMNSMRDRILTPK